MLNEVFRTKILCQSLHVSNVKDESRWFSSHLFSAETNKSDIKSNIVLKFYSLPARRKIFSNVCIVCIINSGVLH